MTQSGFELRFLCFQSPCFSIYLGLSARDRERSWIPEAHWKNPHQYWPCLLAHNFKGSRSWLELEEGGEWTPFTSFPGLSPSSGQAGAGFMGTSPGSAYQGWRGALAGSPDSFPMHKDAFLLPKLAGGSFWNGSSPHPPRLGMIFWQTHVVKSYRWCRHSLEGIPAGPPPRRLLITHQITLAACRILGILAAPGNQLQGQQELLRS